MDAPLSVFLRNGTHASATVRLMLKVDQFATQMSKQPILQSLPGGNPIIFDMNQIKPAVTISGLVDTIGGDLTNTDIGFWHMEKATVSGPNAAGTGVENQTYYVPYKNYLENIMATWSYSDNKLQIEVGDASITELPVTELEDVHYAGRVEAGALTAAVDEDDTSIAVSDASYFYDNDSQLIMIESGGTRSNGSSESGGNWEIMEVRGISGSAPYTGARTLTVARDQKQTSGYAHADDAQIYAIGITPGATGYATGGGIYNVAVNQAQFTHFPGEEDRYAFNVQFVGQVRKGIKF